MIWESVLLCVGAYLIGSIPTAYLAGRWLRGIDIREHGSGNVGGSNVWNTVARWAVVPVGICDIAKGALPVWLAVGPLDLGLPVAMAAGLCASAGHSWPVFLRFTGGRGIACMLGTLAIVFPWGLLFELLIMLVGLLLHVELLTTLGLLALPALTLALGYPPAVAWGCVGMIVFTAIKRVEANRHPIPPGAKRWRVIWRRLWFDRDMESHAEWLDRDPEERRRELQD